MTTGADSPVSNPSSVLFGMYPLNAPENLLLWLYVGKEITDILFWTRGRLAIKLPLHPHHILAFSNIAIWHRPKHSASLWILGHMAFVVINSRKAVTYLDYIDYMLRSPWNTYMWRKRVMYYGNYWDVLG